MYRSPFPPRDDSLDKAARQIMRILEREEREAMGTRSPQARHSSEKEECPTCRSAANARQISYDSLSPIDERSFVPIGGPSRVQAGSVFRHPNAVNGPRAGYTQVSAVPIPAGPLPIIMPEIARPGSEANQEFVDFVLSIYRSLRKILSPEDEEDCDEEWEAARKYCVDILMKGKFGDGRSVTGADIRQCILGHVSEKCGGNPVEYPENGRRR